MKKVMVALLVLVMVFVIMVGVVGANDHGAVKHGGLGYWMNYEFDDDWISLCRNFHESDRELDSGEIIPANPISDFLRTPPRGDAVEILRRHHVVTFLNWSENIYDLCEHAGWLSSNPHTR